MKKVISFIKKYLPDALISLGVLTFSYNLLRPAKYVCTGLCNRFNSYGGYTDYHTSYKMFGIFLLTLGIIIVVRRYLKSKNNDAR
jgi:hypothetical protein